MSSSGTANFNINRKELVNYALSLIHVLREGDVANAAQLNMGYQTLQIIIKNMQSNGLALWTYQQIQIPMVASQNTYTLGPSGADVTVNRPLRLMDGSFIRQTTNGNTYDTPLRLLSRLEYLQFGAKGALGIPNSIYYFPGIYTSGVLTSPVTGVGTLYVYVTPQDATRVIYCNFQRPIYDMNSDSDEFDFPQEWFQVLAFMLAGQLAFRFPQTPIDIAREVRAEALRLQEEAQSWSVENSPVYFQPDMQVNWNARR